MESTSGRPSTPEGASSPADDDSVMLIGAGDAQAARIIGLLKAGDVSGLRKLDQRLKKKQGSSLLQAVGQVAADRLLHLAARWIQFEDRERGRTPMLSALDALDSASTSHKNKNCVKIVELLIRRGASANKARTDGFAPIHAATEKDSLDIIKLLLENGANALAMCKRGTVLHVAAQSATSIAVVKHLLDQGVDPNIPNISGYTALHLAVGKDHFGITNFLLENGAEVNAICKSGSALHIAAASRTSVDVVKLLLDRGADPNATNVNGYTVLHVASTTDSHGIAQLLLKKKAEVDVMCDKGTALLIAAERAGHALVKLLLDNGANPKLTNSSGLTALHFATLKGSLLR